MLDFGHILVGIMLVYIFEAITNTFESSCLLYEANMVSGDIRNPSRDLPAAIHTALPTVIICFLLANVSYYVLIPWSDIGLTDTIAVVSNLLILTYI